MSMLGGSGDGVGGGGSLIGCDFVEGWLEGCRGRIMLGHGT
jgi:hypothetical protein